MEEGAGREEEFARGFVGEARSASEETRAEKQTMVMAGFPSRLDVSEG